MLHHFLIRWDSPFEDATGLDVTRMLQGQFGNALTYKQPWPPPGFSSLMYEKDKGNDVELGDIHVSARGGAADDKVKFVILGDCVQVWIPPWPSFSGATACVKCSVYTSLLLFDNQPWFWKFLLSFQGSLVGTIGSIDFSFEENDEIVGGKEIVVSRAHTQVGWDESTVGERPPMEFEWLDCAWPSATWRSWLAA